MYSLHETGFMRSTWYSIFALKFGPAWKLSSKLMCYTQFETKTFYNISQIREYDERLLQKKSFSVGQVSQTNFTEFILNNMVII